MEGWIGDAITLAVATVLFSLSFALIAACRRLVDQGGQER